MGPSKLSPKDQDDLPEPEDLLDDEPPTDVNPYEVLALEKECTAAEVRTSYRKLALLHHPDKVKSEDKATAHAKFQEIAFAYAILSDEKRRQRYDRTGSTSERAEDDDDFDWKSFYKELFEDVVTGETLTQFKKSYQGSDEERNDVLEAYTNFDGSLDDIFEHVMLSDPLEDEDRFRKIIDQAIKAGEVEAFEAYTAENEKSRKTRRKKAEDEGKEAMEYAKKLGVYDKLFGKDKQDIDLDGKKNSNGSKPRRKVKKTTNPEDDPNHPLAALIRDRQSGRMGSFLDNLEAKYAGGSGTSKRKKKRVVTGEDDMDMEPNEEEFQAARERLGGRAPTTTTKTSKRSKK